MECTAGNSDGESSAKRRRGGPKIKGVVVLLDSDVVRGNDQVYMPNTIELGWLKQKGQYKKTTFSSEMTVEDVRSALHLKFPFLKNKRLSCASAVDKRTRLEFHGERKLWNGTLIKRRIKGNSALYLLAEENHESEDSQVLTGGTVPVAAARPPNVHTSVAGPSRCDQKEPVLNVQTQQKEFEFGMISIPQHQQCLGQDMTTRKRTAPQRGFSQQSSTVSTSKKQENGTLSYILISGDPGIGKTILSKSRGKSGLRVEGLASEQSVYKVSMTTPVQHHGQLELGGKTTTKESALKQSMSTSVAQASVLAATQRLKELSQVHASVSSTADQRHVTGMGSTSVAVVSNANHEGEPEMLQRGEEDLTAQPDHTIDDILQQGLSVVQKRPNGPIVQATVDPAPQESLNPTSVTCKERELIAQSSEQGSSLQQSPAVAAAHTNVPAKGLSSQTTSAKELPDSARKRKSHPHGHQEFPVLVAVSEGEITDSGIDSLENESNHDTDQLRDIVLEISPSKGSTKGGDKFHIILGDIFPLEMESFVAGFQFRGQTVWVHLKQTNLFTLTGITPKSLQGPGPVNVTLMSLDGSWWGGEAVFEYIDDPLSDEEYLNKVVTNEDMRLKMFVRIHKAMSSNKPSDGQTSNSSGKTGPGSSSLNKSVCAWSVKLLQLLVYKAAEIDGQEFIQIIFSTSAGKVVFDSYRNNATLPEDVARVNGHLILADHLQDVNNSLSKECNSDAGTEDIDWLELMHAVDKEQSLTSGTDDAQISEKCQPPGYPESDDDENDYFADDEMSPWWSPCSSPSYTNLRDSENEDHSQNTNMIESSYEKEVNGENLSVENNDSSEFPLHLVGNQLEVIPSMKAKQLDSDDVESYSSGDDITEKEYDSTVPCRDEVENCETVESEVISAIKETSARTTSSRNATHESGLDGDQKELRMTNNAETSRSRVIEFLRKNEEYEEVNIPTENNDSSVFYPDLPPIQAVNDGYEHKQLDYEEVVSHRSEDDMHENENVYRVFKTTQLYPALPNISSYRDTDDVVVTDVTEWGLDGHQKELRMTVNDETTRSRAFNQSVAKNHVQGFVAEKVFCSRALSQIVMYEYKQLDSDDVESYSSRDDITEKEYESTVPCRDEVENWETVESEVISAIKETFARTTSSRNATHESGLDGDQKELRMTDNAGTSKRRDSSVFYSHLKVIPPIQDVNAGYEHKQLDYEEVESHRSEDDMPENEYIYSGFKTDQNELNKITVPPGIRTTNSHASALHSISGLWDTDDVVATNGSEWGLDGDQRELRIIDNDETTRSRGSHEETPCYSTVTTYLESPFSSPRVIAFAEDWRQFKFQEIEFAASRIILEYLAETGYAIASGIFHVQIVECAEARRILQLGKRVRRILELQERDLKYSDTVQYSVQCSEDHDHTFSSGANVLRQRRRIPSENLDTCSMKAYDFDRLFPRDPAFKWAVSKLHQALNEAKLNFQTAVSFWHPLSCHFLSAANPNTALHAEELGRARALADFMTARYSIESQISCKYHSWTYLDEITKKERSSTCLYISCYGQDVFLSILKTSGAISLRKVKVGNNFLHDKLATNLDAVFAIMANSVLSEEDCNKQSVHDIEPKLDSSQILSSCYKLLIDPVSGLLEKPSIIIVPKGSLCLVPFAALLNDESGMYLSDTFRIRIVPSLTTLKLIQDSPADYHSQTGALVVGDPTVGEVIYRGSVSSKFVPLPGARKEAEMVGRLLGVQPLLGQNATKQAILQMLHSVSLIHIAAHGSADRGEIALAPLVPTSGILQEDDYLLKLSDISQVQLRAKLVVLSCCHSGRGQVKSEGIIGMAQAFLGSGARSVLVALGALNDRATEQLMCHFYEHLVRGESASESLHQAMKWMRGNGFTKVSEWAPFTLIGDDVTFDFGEYSRKEESNQTKQVVT